MARRRNRAKKAWRFIAKQRRRRKRMHPTRRRQEDFALVGAVASVPLLLFIGIPAAFFAGVAAGLVGLASKASPPPKKNERRKRPKNLHTGGSKFDGVFTHKQARTLVKKKPCDDTCKYSTHDRKTCDCACGGKNHGMWAWGPSGTTTPKKRPAQRRRTTTRRRKRT